MKDLSPSNSIISFLRGAIALWFAGTTLTLTKEFAIIEYIPIHDIKCQQIFKSRIDKIEYPDEDEFQKEIEKYFRILKVEKLNPTDRKLYLLKLNEI